MSLDSVVAAARNVSKKIVLPIKRQFGCLIASKSFDEALPESFDEALPDEVWKLASEVFRIRVATEMAYNDQRRFSIEVEEWQAIAEKVLMEARELLEDFGKASMTRSYGTLAPAEERYQFSRKAKNMIEVIQRLAKEYSQFKDISLSRGPPAKSPAPPAASPARSSTSTVLMLPEIGDDGDVFNPLADDALLQGAGTSDVFPQFEPPHSAEELERCSYDVESSPPESRKVLMCGGLGLTGPPDVMRWQSFTEIYFMENELTELPENPQCPGLSVLFLNRNCKLRNISPTFFNFMPALEILNLSRTRIKSLPESLFRLSCLKRLFLNHCELLRVLPPKIGELQQLEVLDLEGTEIMDLPKEVAKLTKLTCLEVSFCPCTNCGTKSAKANALIPEGTISALSQLEELSIDIHPDDEAWESVVEAIVDDVCGLMRLDTLKLYFPQVEHLRKWFGTSKVSRSLSHFNFVVGKDAERIMWYLPEGLEFELERWDRSLKYVNGVGVPIDIQKMLRHTTAFFLDRHRDVTNISDFGIDNMEQLKCCMIGECNEVQVIVDGTHMYNKADRSEIILETWEDDRRFLGSLEYLYIYRMKSLRCIYEGPLHQGSLSQLKCLALLTCPQLTSIFTTGLLENLNSLEELNIEDCPLLLSLVSCEDTSIYSRNYFLPKLKRITLVSLPELSSIFSGLCIAPDLERLSIVDCPNLGSPSVDEICCSHLTGAKGGPALTISCSPSSDDVLSRSMGGRSNKPIPSVDIAPNSEARVFSFAELKVATKNFRTDMLISQHGFGKVFKGCLGKKGSSQGEEMTPIAIKVLDAGSMWGFDEWKSALVLFGSLSHPNIVKLMGYCLEDKKLLVYEFMPNGSLDNHLFAKDSAIQPLPWVTRLKIAVGAARGLAFLHQLEMPIIYRDFKTSKILLDKSYNAKITDSGVARYGPGEDASHVSTEVVGTIGYIAPEYILTGCLYVKSDVYSFGVVLVELLIGMRAIDARRLADQKGLVEWVKSYLSKRKLTEIMDPRLGGQYSLKDALDVATLALQCLDFDLSCRPSMDKVVQTLDRISRS